LRGDLWEKLRIRAILKFDLKLGGEKNGNWFQQLPNMEKKKDVGERGDSMAGKDEKKTSDPFKNEKKK